ncbi:MAG: thiol peroxidase [Candidatus Brocadiae bacterium]|nr:thiol peroxidase [Candidatus Brocadiia bacterium]
MTTTLFKGSLVHLAGKEVKVGQDAPEVVLVGKDLSPVNVGGKKNVVQLLVAVPSLDTGVCALETRKFHEKAASLAGVNITIISMDLPFAAGRFCTTEKIEKLTFASDFRNRDFANSYGVLMADGPLQGLTCRAVFIVDKQGKIAYKEIVPEVTQEPDYAKCLAALKNIQ